MAEEMGKFSELMQQAQQHAQKLTGEIEKAQDELTHTQATGEAGAGAVKVTMNGRYNVTKIFIDPKLFNEGQEVVTQLLMAAFNNAVEKVQKVSQKMIAGLAGSMKLPGDLQNLFGGTKDKDE